MCVTVSIMSKWKDAQFVSYLRDVLKLTDVTVKVFDGLDLTFSCFVNIAPKGDVQTVRKLLSNFCQHEEDLNKLVNLHRDLVRTAGTPICQVEFLSVFTNKSSMSISTNNHNSVGKFH